MREVPGSRNDLIGKALRVFLRPSSSIWWCSIKLPKKPRVYRSLGTSDASLAFTEATELYNSYQKRLKDFGDTDIEKSNSLKSIYQQFKEDDPTSKKSGTWRMDIIGDHMDRLWIPYLGKNCKVDSSPALEAKLKKYPNWRRGENVGRKRGYKPATGAKAKAGKSTIRLEIQSLLQIFRHAQKKGLIDRFPTVDSKTMDLEWSKDDALKHRRPAFSDEEVRAMPAQFDNWIAEEKIGYRSNHKWSRIRLKTVALLIACSGARPQEIRKLRNRDLDFQNDSSGKEILILRIGRSKGGTKTIIHSTPCQFFGEPHFPAILMREWQQYQKHTHKRDYVFSLRKGEIPRQVWGQQFSDFLLRNKMRYDKEFGKKRRSLYGLRHQHISHLVKRGVPPALIAKSCGTSLDVIMSSYLHVDDEDLKQALFASG